jgi:hypothetical protein
MTRRQWCTCLLALAVPSVLSPVRRREWLHKVDGMFYADVWRDAAGWHVERFQMFPGKRYMLVGPGRTYTSSAEAHNYIEWWRRAIEVKR